MKAEKNKPEREIVRDLEKVHDSLKNNPENAYNPDELKQSIDDLPEQVKGSDADIDKSLGDENDKTEINEEMKNSDADKD